MQLVYFASMREKIGLSEETFPRPDGVNTVQDLLSYLQGRGAGYAAALAKPDSIRVAVNQTHVRRDHPVDDRDEVAIFPPVTGG